MNRTQGLLTMPFLITLLFASASFALGPYDHDRVSIWVGSVLWPPYLSLSLRLHDSTGGPSLKLLQS